MAHGDPINRVPPEIYDQDPEMWAGFSMSMSEFLLLERALCDCDAGCDC